MTTSTGQRREPGPAPAPGHAPAPTPVSERAIAPDLARGMMLLLIALAHTPWFLFTSEIGATLMHPADGNLADRIAQAFTIVVVDTRTHTMFGFLFAYGIWQLHSRQVAKGLPVEDARRLLRTRHWWLLAFGLVHAVLLWQGDILGTYGLIGLIMVPLFFNRSDRTLKVWIGVLLAIGFVFAVGSFAAMQLLPPLPAVPNAQQPILAETDVLAALVLRVAAWFPGLLSGVASLALPTAFLFGLLAARHRILEEPAKHLPLLRTAAIGGIGVGWSAGLVQVMVHFDMLDLPNPAGVRVSALLHRHLRGRGLRRGVRPHRAPRADARVGPAPPGAGAAGARATVAERLPHAIPAVRPAARGLGVRSRGAPVELVCDGRRDRRVDHHGRCRLPVGPSQRARPGRGRAAEAQLPHAPQAPMKRGWRGPPEPVLDADCR
nr:hypothetical protein [Pseudoclavibacter terrae]